MTPVMAAETAWTTLLATSTTAGLSVALKLVGVITPLTPGEDMSSLVPGDTVAAAVAAGISYAAATRVAARDPATADYIVEIPPPAGGNQESSGGGGTYPVTLYGAILLNNDGGTYLVPDNIVGSKVFDPPIVVTAPGQLIQYGDVSFRFSPGAWF